MKQHFGYNRLGKQLKSCVTCRNKHKQGSEKAQQQSIDTNVNTVCSRCCQIKPKPDVGEYKIQACNTELKRTRTVVISYKSCERCRSQHNTYREDNHDLDKTSQRQQSYR